MTDSQKPKKPQVAYRVELEKRIQINKSFSERRNQAVAMRILSYGLFGQKRYQNLYLTCSLNCFYLALKIANNIHQRVAGLAMIIKFETVQVLEYFVNEVNGKYFEEKKYSKIIIKLTRNPTEEDKKEPGFNPGLTNEQVQQPLSEVLKRKRRDGEQRPQQRGDRERRNRDNRDNRDNRGRREQKNPRRRDQGRRYRQMPQERVKENEQYRRGQRRTRGGYKGTNTSRREEDQRDNKYIEKRRQQDRRGEKDERGRKEQKGDRERREDQDRRGDRRPKRRYDDEDD